MMVSLFGSVVRDERKNAVEIEKIHFLKNVHIQHKAMLKAEDVPVRSCLHQKSEHKVQVGY
jgi:predicted nucleotidyltransferase